MARYVIGPDVAARLAHDQAVIGGGHQILPRRCCARAGEQEHRGRTDAQARPGRAAAGRIAPTPPWPEGTRSRRRPGALRCPQGPSMTDGSCTAARSATSSRRSRQAVDPSGAGALRALKWWSRSNRSPGTTPGVTNGQRGKRPPSDSGQSKDQVQADHSTGWPISPSDGRETSLFRHEVGCWGY
jgi:hypothetical protein